MPPRVDDQTGEGWIREKAAHIAGLDEGRVGLLRSSQFLLPRQKSVLVEAIGDEPRFVPIEVLLTGVRSCRGGMPKRMRNARLNWLVPPKPQYRAISVSRIGDLIGPETRVADMCIDVSGWRRWLPALRAQAVVSATMPSTVASLTVRWSACA